MFGQTVGGRDSNTSAGNRSFRYEVVGLHQNDETNKMEHEIRSSASVFLTVPYSRMNQEMQRITRMGGKIVSIQPLTVDGANNHSKSAESAKSPEAVEQ
jgi:sulfite reductase alpha subunit-like flavoprotein